MVGMAKLFAPQIPKSGVTMLLGFIISSCRSSLEINKQILKLLYFLDHINKLHTSSYLIQLRYRRDGNTWK
jgi:hypothetical protein